MLPDDVLARRARRLRDALEPFVGQVYFSPECHRAYEALGFAPSSGDAAGVALPDGPAYFTSRGSLLGQVPGEVVAATFAVFNPEVVVPCVARGWQLTDAATIRAARTDGALAQLRRILGHAPEGVDRAAALARRAAEAAPLEVRPLAAGVASGDRPGEPLGDLWHAGDLLRELRGDAHNAAWSAAGLDAVEIGLLTELWWGLPLRSYIRTRAWSEARLDAAVAGLEARGLVRDGAFTEQGRAVRAEVELATDRQLAPVLEALGRDGADELCDLLEPWGAAIRAGKGYLGGAGDLADRARRS